MLNEQQMTVMPHRLSQKLGHTVTLKDSHSDKNVVFLDKPKKTSTKMLFLLAGLEKSIANMLSMGAGHRKGVSRVGHGLVHGRQPV